VCSNGGPGLATSRGGAVGQCCIAAHGGARRCGAAGSEHGADRNRYGDGSGASPQARVRSIVGS